jgi:hypothetical protein
MKKDKAIYNNTTYKTLPKKQIIEQHQPYEKPGSEHMGIFSN